MNPTPIEQLTEMNAMVGRTRKRKATPIDPTKKVERFYRAQLQSLVRAMTKEVKAEVLPIVRQEADQYRATVDAVPTMDSWADRIIEALNRLIERYTVGTFSQQYQRLAARTVSLAEADSTGAFVRSVNKAVGVDLNPVLNSDGMRDYIDIATDQNLKLIKSVPEEYFKRIEQAVMGGVRGGDSPAVIARNIQEATGVSTRRAKLLARDQSAKLSSEITERRQTQAGISHYRSVTSNDERVSGRPGGKYPNAKISCWGIARQDVGYGPGVYRWDQGASWGGETGLHPGRHHIQCRCVSVPVFEFELPEGKR